MKRFTLVTVFTLVVLRSHSATADGPGLPSAYFYDTGAIAFVYLPTAIFLATEFAAPTRQTPLFFSSTEGGQSQVGSAVPGRMLALGAATGVLTTALIPDRTRWYHLKGFIQSLTTTGALTSVAKHTFGRQRPTFRLGEDQGDSERHSFFSGHSSVTLATTVYLALHLHENVFPGRRENPLVHSLEALTYLGLAGIAFYVPYTRVKDKHHHLTDALVGASVGAASSILFFYWQDAQYQRDKLEGAGSSGKPRLLLSPNLGNLGVSLVGYW